jgi:GNAT superfamily N-acetyltransferase
MIRDAQLTDIPRIVEMGQHFREGTRYDIFLRDNPQKMTELAELLTAQKGLLVSERSSDLVGMLGFIRHSHFISGDPFAGEVFWWVEPDKRGEGVKLLVETERRARDGGSKYIQMIAPNQKVAQFYSKMGYEYVEEIWQKQL